jgi:hypothetical protein
VSERLVRHHIHLSVWLLLCVLGWALTVLVKGVIL